MKKEFQIQETWVSFQLRPGTPREGIPLAELFPGVDIKERYASLNRVGEPLGCFFGERTLLSNSGPALEASEYARDKGKYDVFHERVFLAYFSDLLDIGETGILCKLAQDVGLDPQDMRRSLDEGIYRSRIDESMEEAARYGVTAIPTFIINEARKIVGAQSLQVFRDQLRRIVEHEE